MPTLLAGAILIAAIVLWALAIYGIVRFFQGASENRERDEAMAAARLYPRDRDRLGL